MKQLLLIFFVCIAALTISACRIGGGFDGEGRLVSRQAGGDPVKTEPVKADPVKTDPGKTAPQVATIVYLIPAG